jgi:ligand-binding sensor domain-containing protein/two-component sensor histidine kinase
MINKIFLFLFCLFYGFITEAQKYQDVHFDVYSTEYIKIQRGLSQNSINCMLEDRNGFIWIGTWDGLNRFDGYDFVIYKPGLSDKNYDISNETVNVLLEDDDGNIWVGTDEGLNVFHPAEMEFTVYYIDTVNKPTMGENRILSLVTGKKNELWVGTDNGLYVFHTERQEFVLIPFPSDILLKKQLTIFSLYRSFNSEQIWVGTNLGLYRFDINTYKYTALSRSFASLSDARVTSLLEDSRGNVWIGTQMGLFVIDASTGDIRHFHQNNSILESNNILSIMEDQSRLIWIGTGGGGVVNVDLQDGRFYSFGNDDEIFFGLSNNYIYSLMQSGNGSVWIGTWRGLNKFDPGQFRFTHITYGEGIHSLNTNMIWSFLEISPDVIWIGTEKGVNVYNRKQRKFTYNTISSGRSLHPFSDKIRAMFLDSRGRYWIGTFEAGLVCYDPATGTRMFFESKVAGQKGNLSGNSIWGITEDDDQSVWVATSGGASRIFGHDSIINYYHDPGDTMSISQGEMYGVYKDSKNNIWFSSFSGVDIFNREDNSFDKFGKGLGEENRLKTNRILSVFEDTKGNYWFATMGEGVSKFNPVTGEMVTINMKEGLPNNTAYNFVEDKNGSIWVTTNHGISKINPENMNIWNFDVRDGIQGHEFNLGAALGLSTGEIIVGGMNGINIFNPEHLQENVYEPMIYITKFSVYNEWKFDLLKDNDVVHLKWNENYFSFEFAALDYSNPKKINYAYMLEGFDNDWNYVPSDRRYADYTNVPPGKYFFRVRSTNSDGLWSTKELSIEIIVRAPFWKTLWFKIVAALILTFLIWYTVNNQIRKIRKKQEIDRKIFESEKTVFELEQKVLHLQMNPHFLFNTLNSIQSFIMKNETDNAVEYLSKFSKLMRLMLLTSRASNVVLADELKLLQLYLDIESLRFDFVFHYQIRIDPDIEEEFTAIPPQMVQPLIENSIKHGLLFKEGDGLVEVFFKQYEDYIEITVTDNGIGRARAAEIQERKRLTVTNQGIAITRERLSIFNRQKGRRIYSLEYTDLFGQDGKPSGTKAVLKIPYVDV